MDAIASGLVGGAIAFAAILFAEYRQSPARRDGRGWTVLRAGWLLRLTMMGSAAIAAFLLCFLVAGGSARPDAELQNGYALALLFITAGIGAYTAWTGYGRSIRWRNDVLLIRSNHPHLIGASSKLVPYPQDTNATTLLNMQADLNTISPFISSKGDSLHEIYQFCKNRDISTNPRIVIGYN